MEKEIFAKYVHAGKIAAEALDYGRTLIKSGTKVIDILNKVETKIKHLNGQLAFPAQISLNECAAHSCSDLNDAVLLEAQVVKLDVGVHLEGYIADNALTVDLSEKYHELVKASREALENALKIAAPGITLSAIGKTIQETITSYGYAPVKNLSGHGLGRFNIHDTPSVPNFENGNTHQLTEDMVIAIEPFASTGAGIIQESSPATVFSLVKDCGIRDPITRNILQEIKTYQKLPFAKRWLELKFGTPKTNFALRNLIKNDCLIEHFPLVDTVRGIVSQAEHSVIVREKPVVLTRV